MFGSFKIKSCKISRLGIAPTAAALKYSVSLEQLLLLQKNNFFNDYNKIFSAKILAKI